MKTKKSAEDVCGGGIGSSSVGHQTSSKFFKPISIFISAFALSVSGIACGGSENDGPDDEGGLILPSNCTQADQFCSPDGVNGYICQNGSWSVAHCDEGTTCSRTNDGVLSCVPTNSTNNNTNNNNNNNSSNNNNNQNNNTNNNTNTNVDSGITWVSIPAGSLKLKHSTYLFVSGSTIPIEAFQMGKTEVTVAQFEKCVKAGACNGTFTSYNSGAIDDDEYCNYNRGDNWKNHPMNCVNWYGALQYCTWAGGRLPTEEEWEYAATHNGTKALQTKYPWGNSAPVHCKTANYYVNWRDTDYPYCDGKNESSTEVGTSPVGTYSPAGDSPLGLVDMSGNVWEWTGVVFLGMDYTAPFGKGGAFTADAEHIEVTNNADPGGGTHFMTGFRPFNGFRCVKDN